MKSFRLYSSFVVAAAVAMLLLTVARADETETATLKFSDPSKPGVLKVAIASGDVQIRGTDAAEITVQSDLKQDKPAERPDGLRVLTSSSSYSLTEKNNLAVLSYGADSWGGNGGSFVITVPRTTSVIVSCSFGGDVAVADISGSIEVKGLNGEVKLDNITGAAAVETLNGEIKANVRELAAGKPLSLVSMNGEVTLCLPATAKANVRLRTHNGSILTDFDDKALVTKTESIRFPGSRVRVHTRAPRAAGDSSDEVREAIHEAVTAGAAAAQEAANAVREVAVAAHNAERDARRRAEADADGEVAPLPPAPPAVPLPPVTGGKVVTGTLNGGGPEIRITTMNGDVTIRKLAGK
ncbi:MAG: hypothetical protein JSR48_14835 [Verrucomicrobia bacterium]|nr:hypothetical protein [Verrucomicrobiota bacterium]